MEAHLIQYLSWVDGRCLCWFTEPHQQLFLVCLVYKKVMRNLQILSHWQKIWSWIKEFIIYLFTGREEIPWKLIKINRMVMLHSWLYWSEIWTFFISQRHFYVPCLSRVGFKYHPAAETPIIIKWLLIYCAIIFRLVISSRNDVNTKNTELLNVISPFKENEINVEILQTCLYSVPRKLVLHRAKII